MGILGLFAFTTLNREMPAAHSGSVFITAVRSCRDRDIVVDTVAVILLLRPNVDCMFIAMQPVF